MNKPPDETLKQGRNRSWLLVNFPTHLPHSQHYCLTQTLTEVCLRTNRIGDEWAKLLANALTTNTVR